MQMPSRLHDIIQTSENLGTQRYTSTELQEISPHHHNNPPQTLYALYSYSSDLEDGQIRSNWRLEFVTDDRLTAFETAKDLYNNPHFDKIEIKKTAYDHKNKTRHSMTIKTWQRRTAAHVLQTTIGCSLKTITACAGIGIAALYLLTVL